MLSEGDTLRDASGYSAEVVHVSRDVVRLRMTISLENFAREIGADPDRLRRDLSPGDTVTDDETGAILDLVEMSDSMLRMEGEFHREHLEHERENGRFNIF
jgi:hypothetical protein